MHNLLRQAGIAIAVKLATVSTHFAASIQQPIPITHDLSCCRTTRRPNAPAIVLAAAQMATVSNHGSASNIIPLCKSASLGLLQHPPAPSNCSVCLPLTKALHFEERPCVGSTVVLFARLSLSPLLLSHISAVHSSIARSLSTSPARSPSAVSCGAQRLPELASSPSYHLHPFRLCQLLLCATGRRCPPTSSFFRRYCTSTATLSSTSCRVSASDGRPHSAMIAGSTAAPDGSTLSQLDCACQPVRVARGRMGQWIWSR